MAGTSTQIVRVVNVSNMARGLPIMFNALPGIVGTPGPAGPPGPGSYTSLTNPFTVPNPGTSVNVTVGNTEWMVGGASVFIQGAGYYTVQSVFDQTHATLVNTNTPGNAGAGTIIATPAGVSAAGAQGGQGIQGIQGPVGPQGAQGPQGTGIVYRGTWSASTSYSVNDSVTYGGSSYVALKTSLNVIPGTDPTTWGIFAAQGATGAQGAPGIQGSTGATGPQGVPGPASTALTTAQFTQPAVNAAVTVPVTQTAWCPAGSVVFIAGGGYYEVISVPDSTDLVLNNPGWQGAATPGTVVPSGALVTAGGVQGAAGDPGATGPPGPQGTPGTAGARAYSITSASFVVPVAGSLVSLTVDSTAWMTVNAVIYIPGAGYYQIASVGGANLLTATNLGYQGNASPGTTIASGAYVYAGGAPQAPNREYYKTDFENGWSDWLLTSGTATKGPQVDADSQGIVVLGCAAGSGQTYGFQIGTGAATVQVGNRTTYFHAKVMLQQLSTSADSFGFYFGWLDNVPSGAFQNGIFFYYTNAGSTPNNWGCYCRRAGTQVFDDSGIAVQTGRWYDLQVTIDSVYATFSIASYAQGATPIAPVVVAQIAISQCPAAGLGLGPVFGGSKISGSTVAPSFYLDCYDHEIQYAGAPKFRQPAMIGPAGKNSYTGTTGSFITPNVSQSVVVSVADTSFMAPGMQLYIAGAGSYQVQAVQSATQVNVINTGATGNAAPSTLVNAGATVSVSGVAGPPGVQGPLGPTGPVGQGAYTTLTNSFIQPPINATVNIPVVNSNWMAPGMTIYIQSGGYYVVQSVPNPQNLTVVNPGYSGNAAPGATVLNNSQVSPGGIVGPAGVDPAIVGSIMQWPAIGIPQGWLTADGSAVSRTTYPQLYTALGGLASPWGQGDGATTFNLPDLRGRTLIGAGQGSGLTSRVLGTVGGSEMHTLQIAEMPNHSHGLNWSDPGHYHTITDVQHSHGQTPHSHGVSDNGHYHASAGYTSVNYGMGGGFAFFEATAANTSTNPASIGIQTNNANISAAYTGITRTQPIGSGISASVQAAGGNNPFNMMNPWAAVNYIIKAAYNVPVGPTVPMADTTQPGLVTKMSGLNTDYVGGDNATHDLGSMVRSVAPVVRSYNSLGNPTFEIDNITIGAGVNASGFALNRWQYIQTGPNRGTSKQTAGQVTVAGTNFCLSQWFLRYTLTTQEGTLGAASGIIVASQLIEGIRLRELLGGSTAVTVVARCSVAGTVFAVALRDSTGAYSVVNLVTIASANAWTMFPIGSIPLWTASGNFPTGIGATGYQLAVAIAAGSNSIAPSTNTWVAGSFFGAAGMSNFAANPVGATFDVGYIMHEPGATPNGPLDKDFEANLRECARHYQKGRAYTQLACQGNVIQVGQLLNNSTTVRAGVRFGTEMAKTPTVRMVGSGVTTLNTCYIDAVGNSNIASIAADSAGIDGITLAAASNPGSPVAVLGDWDASTGL
jgi:microcystin-dependent protein